MILPLQKEWTINKSKGVKKPYFSISKSIGNKWYEKPIDEIAKLWDDMHGECEKIRNLLTNTQKP